MPRCVRSKAPPDPWGSRSSARRRHAQPGDVGEVDRRVDRQEDTNMARKRKKYVEAAKLVDHEHVYTPLEAVELAKQTTYVAFDASIEAHLRLRVQPRPARQIG